VEEGEKKIRLEEEIAGVGENIEVSTPLAPFDPHSR
jgi:hypothetical protein